MSELIGKTILSRYRVDAFLGKGGMADVYRVWDQTRSTYLAMKVLDPKLAKNEVFIANFKQEAKTLRILQHPNIVRFYGLEGSEKLVFMLMDFVEGKTLRQEIHQYARPFDSQKIIQIMRPICAALNYAHHQGFIHCDIKPPNIMLHTNGTVLLADFGISRLAGSASGNLQKVGTPAYMSPEQIDGKVPAPATDIYSLGILLFEMLTGGKRPFTGQHARTSGNTTERLRWEQRHLPPPSPRQYHPIISSSLEAVVMRCLEKKPEQRYERILHFQNALEEALAKDISQSSDTSERVETTTPIEKVSTDYPPLREQNNRITASWIGLAILVPLVILLSFYTRSRGDLSKPSTYSASNPLGTPIIFETPTPTWVTYSSTRPDFNIDYPPSWVYQEQGTDQVIVFASSQEALSANGYVSDGAAMAIAHTPLTQADLPSTTDTSSPASILDNFVYENFDNPNQLDHTATTNIRGYPAATAVYSIYDSKQSLNIILYGVALVTPKTLTLMMGICPETEWLSYKPIFNGMRDSLELH